MHSVITLTYNRASIIQPTIESVLKQTHTDFEYIIIDDGSTDDTDLVVQRYSEYDKRIKYVKVSHSGKLTVLRNKAVALSRGEFIAFIDSDDTWHENYLMDAAKVLSENDNAAFSISDNRKQLKKFNKNGFSLFELIITQNFPPYTCSIVFRKSVMQTTGFYDEEMIIGDIDFFTRLSYFFDGVLVWGSYYNIHKSEDSISAAHEESCYREVMRTLEKLKPQLQEKNKYAKAMAVICKNYAYHFYKKEKFLRATEYYAKSLKHAPAQPRVLFRWGISQVKAILARLHK